MSITLLTGIAAVVGLFLLGRGMVHTVRDWTNTPIGKVVEVKVEKYYPEKGTMRYATASTILWLLDVIFTIGIPVAGGYILDPYSGPFVGGVVGIIITIWRGRTRSKFEQKIYNKRRNENAQRRTD